MSNVVYATLRQAEYEQNPEKATRHPTFARKSPKDVLSFVTSLPSGAAAIAHEQLERKPAQDSTLAEHWRSHLKPGEGGAARASASEAARASASEPVAIQDL